MLFSGEPQVAANSLIINIYLKEKLRSLQFNPDFVLDS